MEVKPLPSTRPIHFKYNLSAYIFMHININGSNNNYYHYHTKSGSSLTAPRCARSKNISSVSPIYISGVKLGRKPFYIAGVAILLLGSALAGSSQNSLDLVLNG